MKLSPLLVFLWLRLDLINDFFGSLTELSFIAVLIFGLLFLISEPADDNDSVVDNDNSEHSEDILLWWLKTSIISMCIFGFLTFITPNTKEFALIYILPTLANSKFVQELSTRSSNDVLLMLKMAEKELENKISDKRNKSKE